MAARVTSCSSLSGSGRAVAGQWQYSQAQGSAECSLVMAAHSRHNITRSQSNDAALYIFTCYALSVTQHMLCYDVT